MPGEREYTNKSRPHPTFRGWGYCSHTPSFSGGGRLPFSPTFRRCGHHKHASAFRRRSNNLGRGNSETSRVAGSKHCSNPPYSSSQTSFSWKIATSSQELGDDHSGPLGVRSSVRSEVILHTHTFSDQTPYHESFLRGSTEHFRGSPILARERGCNASSPKRGGPAFPLLPVHSPQERGWAQAHNQPETSEHIYPSLPLQNGGHTIPKGHHPAKRLCAETGPKGRILRSPDSQTGPEISGLQVGGPDVQIHLPPIWAVQRPQSVHKDYEDSRGIPEGTRGKNGHLSGRHALPLSEGGGASPLEESGTGPPGEPGFLSQLPQVLSDPFPEDRISGILAEHSYAATAAPQGQTVKDSEGGSEPPAGGHSISKAASSAYRNLHIHPPSHPPGPAPLPGPSGTETCHPEERGLQHVPISDCGGQRGPTMVGSEPSTNEQQSPAAREPSHGHQDRCVPNRLGRSLPGGCNRRPVDKGGEIPPHQLSRVAGCHVRSPGICQRQTEYSDSAPHRQCYIGSLHQSHGRDKVPPTVCTSQDPMGLVHPEGHLPGCLPHSGGGQRRGGFLVKVSGGSPRLATESCRVPETEHLVGPPGGGPICLSNNQTTGPVLQLEAGPISRSRGCLPAELDRTRRIRQPPWGLVGRCLQQVLQEEATIVLVTPHWPSQVWFPALFPLLLDYPRLLPDLPDLLINHNQLYEIPLPDRANQLVAWHISGDRTKVQEFQRKLSPSLCPPGGTQPPRITRELWCGGKGINPISPSLGNILNFMAAEYGSGRGYRSLNCYKSALSSVLAPIDGFDVGRHPLVCRLMKGVFQQRPPKPKHTAFWSVKVVLDHLSSWGDNDLLSLQRLSWKLAMLLALSSASRSSDLSRLSIDNHLCSGDSLTLHPLGLSKQSRAGHLPTPIQFKAYSGNKKLCPVHCFKAYDKATGNIRVPGHSGLLIAIKKPHLPVSSSTIARWLKTTLSSAGVDTTQFSAHSTRGAASSSAFMAGLTTKQILSTADWSSADTFKTFYLREADTSVRAPRQGFDVDTLLKASKSRCDMEPEPNDIQSQNG